MPQDAAPGRSLEPDAFTYGPFQAQFLSLLGGVYERAADIGESFVTAAAVVDGDFDSWFAAWTALGDRVKGIGDASAAGGHRVSAQEAYLRASNYYARAAFFTEGLRDRTLGLPVWEKHRAAFDAFAARLDVPAEPVLIPYEGATLPGYAFRVNDSGRPRPWIIFNNGSDGSITGMWVSGIAAALRRGYNALAFDGPGQNAALFRQGLFFRPDWEAVITPVVDYLIARPDVIADRITLFGISQAGYWVPRAAAFEHRLAAAIVDPAVWDVMTPWTTEIPADALGALFSASGAELEGIKQQFDAGVGQGEAASPAFKFTIKSRMFPFGTDSFSEALLQLRAYNLNGVAEKIACPVLIASPEGEQFWPGDSQKLFDALTGPKTLIDFTAAEGADRHCEPKAQSLRGQRFFDWLDDLFAACTRA